MIELSQLDAWQIYAAIGLILCILEMTVPSFILLPIGVAFLLTALLTIWVTSFPVQLVILFLSAVGIFLASRKYFPRDRAGGTKTNVEHMLGREVLVEEIITPTTTGGIKLYGDTWRALSADGQTHLPGSLVTIQKLEGNKVWVTAKTAVGPGFTHSSSN